MSQKNKKDFAFNNNFVASSEGAVLLQQSPVYYQWVDKPAAKMKRNNLEKNVSLREIYQKQQAFQRLLNWHFLQSISDAKK